MEATVALAAANEGISMNNLASPKRIPSNFLSDKWEIYWVRHAIQIVPCMWLSWTRFWTCLFHQPPSILDISKILAENVQQDLKEGPKSSRGVEMLELGTRHKPKKAKVIHNFWRPTVAQSFHGGFSFSTSFWVVEHGNGRSPCVGWFYRTYQTQPFIWFGGFA